MARISLEIMPHSKRSTSIGLALSPEPLIGASSFHEWYMHCNIHSRMRGSGANSSGPIGTSWQRLIHYVRVVLLVYDAGPMGQALWMLALRHSLTPFALPMCHFELPLGSRNQLTILCCCGNRRLIGALVGSPGGYPPQRVDFS